MIDVSPTDFYKLHGGLVRVLRALAEAGEAGLPTRKVSEQVLHSRSYGWKILVQAEELGYIKRKKKKKTDGPGHPWTMNYITAAGRRIVEQMEGVE